MSKSRRQEITRIAKLKNIHIIEDDVYGQLVDGPPPISSFLPNQSTHITSLAKTISVGLRLAFVRPPKELRQALLGKMRASHFFAPPLMCEIAARWIEDGTAKVLLGEQKQTALHRQQIANEILPKNLLTERAYGNHCWLTLPDAWSSETLSRAARENGVNLYTSHPFASHDSVPTNAIRIALGAARNAAELRIGLNVVSRLLIEQVDDYAAGY